MASDVQLICDALSRAPYYKNYSVVQLQKRSALEIIQLIHLVLREIDQENPQSIHRVDLKSESPIVTTDRFVFSLQVLAFADYELYLTLLEPGCDTINSPPFFLFAMLAIRLESIF